MREFADFVLGLDQLDAARLAPAARVHLRLHDPAVSANLLGGLHGLLGRLRGKTLRYGQAVLGKQLLALIFVQIHALATVLLL